MQAEITLRQAAQQALEALDEYKYAEARTALRAALAEPEQPHDLLCVCGAEWDIYSDGREELVTAPTPRKPLTDEEIQSIWAKTFEMGSSANTFAKAIERAHGIGEQHE